MPGVRGLPSLAQMQALRRATPKGAAPSRLEERQAERKTAAKQEAEFRQAVRTRDRGRCRCCGRAVITTIALDSRQAQVHHIHGRGKGLRYEVRAALVLCLECHQRVTGMIGKPKLFIEATKTFLCRSRRFTDANYRINFREGK